MLEYIQLGGPMMWVILAVSFLIMVLFLERFFHLHRAQLDISHFLDGVLTILRRGNTVEAITICEETPGPAATVVRAAILYHDHPPEVVRKAIQEAGLVEIPRLERNLNLIGTLTQVLPLLGLLGTVVGLAELFNAMEQQAPLVHAGHLSGGLWVALLTSILGLAVAIPSYIGYNLLISRVESIIHDMERAASEILTFLATHKKEKAPDAS